MKTINLLILVGSLCLSSLVYSAETTGMSPQKHAQCSQFAYLFTRDPSNELVQMHMDKAVKIGGLPLANAVYQLGLAEGLVNTLAKIQRVEVAMVAKIIYKDLCSLKEM